MLINSIADAVGNTPLLRLSRVGVPNGNEIYAKCEFFNPIGGLKDRTGLFMMREALRRGELSAASVVVEATAGNTGLGLALGALEVGCSLVLVIPEHFSPQKQRLLRMLGAKVVNTAQGGGMLAAVERAGQLLATLPRAVSLRQFDNPDNPRAHYEMTAREIWDEMGAAVDFGAERGVRRGGECGAAGGLRGNFGANVVKNRGEITPNSNLRENWGENGGENGDENSRKNDGANLRENGDNEDKSGGENSRENHHHTTAIARPARIDFFVAGAGSGGSFCGVARFLKERDSRVRAVLCDPLGSHIGGLGEDERGVCSHIEGIGNAYIPRTMDVSLIDRVIKVGDDAAQWGVRELARCEGVLAGLSSGAAFAACMRLAGEVRGARIVTIFADRLERYIEQF